MAQTNLNVSEVVNSLGGSPRSDEGENLQLLANEIIILREKLKQAEEAEVRAERRAGSESAARARAEKRADLGEDALDEIEAVIGRTKRKALASGTPMLLKDEGRGIESPVG
jgi:hypothetical protein